MYSVGSGMVLAIGDLAGATFVTLLGRHGNTVRPCGSPMDPMHDRDRVAVRLGWSGMALAIDDPWRRSCRS